MIHRLLITLPDGRRRHVIVVATTPTEAEAMVLARFAGAVIVEGPCPASS